ncbi:MAG: hypothetical protein AB1651_16815 [Pseudomonadota bacterium]
MNSTKLLAHLLAIAQHSSEIRRELERGDAARAMVEAHAGRLLKTAARHPHRRPRLAGGCAAGQTAAARRAQEWIAHNWKTARIGVRA